MQILMNITISYMNIKNKCAVLKNSTIKCCTVTDLHSLLMSKYCTVTDLHSLLMSKCCTVTGLHSLLMSKCCTVTGLHSLLMSKCCTVTDSNSLLMNKYSTVTGLYFDRLFMIILCDSLHGTKHNANYTAQAHKVAREG